jgi:hypothetical protein
MGETPLPFSVIIFLVAHPTNQRATRKRLKMKSKSLTPERLERIKKILTENQEKDARAKREWNANECEECRQPLRDCLCEDN